jgi:hypothetical protein
MVVQQLTIERPPEPELPQLHAGLPIFAVHPDAAYFRKWLRVTGSHRGFFSGMAPMSKG